MKHKLIFKPVGYWNKEKMSLGDAITDEQWKEVEDICEKLNAKYYNEDGCRIHPNQEQYFSIGLFNDYVDVQIQKSDTCMCHDIVERMINIRNDEMFDLNPNHYVNPKS